jgi:hypothetical protein
MTKQKQWFKSRTVWLGIFTISAGIVAVLESNFPTIGWVATASGIVQVFLRFVSTTPIE